MEVYRPEDAFSLNLRTFTLYGIWPSSVKHPVLRFLYQIYGYLIHLFYIMALISTQFVHMYIVRGDLKELVYSSFYTMTCVGYAPKLIMFILQRRKVEEFLKRLNSPLFSPKRKEHLDVFKKSVVTATISSWTFFSLSIGTCISWIILPLINNKQEKTLLYAAWYPYNTTAYPAYAYTFGVQAFFLLTTAAINSMIDMMTTNFYVVMVGQMEILKLEFKQLTEFIVINNSATSMTKKNFYDDNNLDQILNDRIINCTLRYQAIIKYVNDVTNFFQIGIIAQVFVSSITICTTTYEMSITSPSTLEFYAVLQYQVCMLFQIFIYSWRGNDITLKTTQLKDSVYECGWISVPNIKFRKSLCIIMQPLQIPLTLCVGKFFPLTVNTFFKETYSVLFCDIAARYGSTSYISQHANHRKLPTITCILKEMMEAYRPEDAFCFNLRTFKLYGIWPSSVKHPVLRLLYKIYGYAIHLFYIVIFLCTQFFQLFLIRGDLKDFVDSSFFTLTCVGYVPKLVIFILRRKKVEEFFERLHDPIFVPKRKEHLEVLKESNVTAATSTGTLLFLAIGTCITWIIFPLIDMKQEKKLLYAAWYPYNTTQYPAYECAYVLQVYMLLTTAAVNTTIDMVVTNIYVIMVGQIEILKQEFSQLTDFIAINIEEDESMQILEKDIEKYETVNPNKEESLFRSIHFYDTKHKQPFDTYVKATVRSFDKIDDNKLDEILKKRITKCTLRYQAILKFLNDITDFFQIGILAQVCVSSIIICVTSYEMTTISYTSLQFYTVIQYQVCMLLQILNYTWRGNEITLKTKELKDAVYECGWTYIPNVKFRKSLCIIMSPLQFPLTLCVGKFFPLSVNTFFKIIKMAYTFYVLLKQVNAKNK